MKRRKRMINFFIGLFVGGVVGFTICALLSFDDGGNR